VIGFSSGEAACGHCPLSFLCLLGKPLVVDKKVGDTYLGEDYLFHKKRVQFNDLNVRYCPRCFCVHFQIGHERYLCGILRTGVMTPGYEKGQGPVYHAVGGRHRRRTQTSGCNKANRLAHPLTFEAGVKLLDKETGEVRGCLRDTSTYDCFDEFRSILTEVY
jgi:hypothetical protein